MQLLTARIIHECLKKLLAAGTPLALEKLLKLLQIAGPSLREEKGLTEYYSPLKEMVEKKKVPSRLRLLMQNFLELHEPDWKPKALECTGNKGKISCRNMEELDRGNLEGTDKQDLEPEFESITPPSSSVGGAFVVADLHGQQWPRLEGHLCGRAPHHCTMLPLSTKSCLKSNKLRPILNGQFCHAISKYICLNVFKYEHEQP